MTAEEYLRQKYGAHRGHYEWRALEEAFNAGVAAERDGCADHVEELLQPHGCASFASDIAAAIRARGGKE